MNSRALVISVATRFASKLLSGEKTVELRRRFPKIAEKQRTLLYSSRGDRAMVGWAIISSSEQMAVEEIWRRFSASVGLERIEFDQYFDGVDVGYAVQFKEIYRLLHPVPLAQLQSQWSFTPPQSYCYASMDFFEAIVESGRESSD